MLKKEGPGRETPSRDLARRGGHASTWTRTSVAAALANHVAPPYCPGKKRFGLVVRHKGAKPVRAREVSSPVAWDERRTRPALARLECLARVRGKWSQPVSRVLLERSLWQPPPKTVIPLGARLPVCSSYLPAGLTSRPCSRNCAPAYLVLLRMGFTSPALVAKAAVRSYRTVSPLP